MEISWAIIVCVCRERGDGKDFTFAIFQFENKKQKFVFCGVVVQDSIII